MSPMKPWAEAFGLLLMLLSVFFGVIWGLTELIMWWADEGPHIATWMWFAMAALVGGALWLYGRR